MQNRETGSALIEAVVIGSIAFVIAATAIAAAIRVSAGAFEVAEAAWTASIHAARYADDEVAQRTGENLLPGYSIEARRGGEGIQVVASAAIELAHPTGSVWRVLRSRSEMPLAPFRSNRG